MARIAKPGLSYYSIDTDKYQDIKIKRLKHAAGPAGVAVYDYILCEIYRVKGCFLEWDDSRVFDVANYFGMTESAVGEIVNLCCNVGLFDKAVRTSGGVLTSSSIQSRYAKICADAKRKDFEIPEFIKITPELIPKTPERISKTPDEVHIVKNSIVENSKEKKIIIPPEFEFLDYCLEQIPDTYHSLEFSLKAKYAAWIGDGWKDGHGKKITNWKTKILNTIPYLKQNATSKNNDHASRRASAEQLGNFADKALREYERGLNSPGD